MESEQHSPQIALWLKLIRAEGIGPTLFKRLLDYFGDVERIFHCFRGGIDKGRGHWQQDRWEVLSEPVMRLMWTESSLWRINLVSGLFICRTSGIHRH